MYKPEVPASRPQQNSNHHQSDGVAQDREPMLVIEYRDDKFDEKWTLSPGRDDIRRQVSTSDDDKTYDQEYRLRGDFWLRK